ncbi:MAG: BamA/TamA family outer membrane protein [Planctomycetes bacterium]|nr:BamA/TamA family outer membrane protein [Planctomycetota bacterium]
MALALAAGLGLFAAVPAQEPVPAPQEPRPPEPAPQPPPVRVEAPQGPDVFVTEQVRALQKRPVREIQFQRRADDGPLQPLDAASAESFTRSLLTRVGQEFEQRKVSTDCVNLWNERRMVVTAYAIPVDAEVVVRFVVEREVEVYEGVEFVGMKSLDRATVDGLLGLSADRQVTRTEAEAMRKVLLSRYRRDGYAFCSIDLEERPVADGEPIDDPSAPGGPPRARDVARFVVDEGPQVTVAAVRFVGNVSFAGAPHFNLFGSDSYLLRDSHILSDPASFLSGGAAYSREILEEDVDRLRLFYRSRGFLDASVDIADVRFAADRESVEITIVVVEGPRYTIEEVRVEHIDASGRVLTEPPRYSEAEILGECKVAPGDFYDHDRLQRDWQAIQDFYGRRGHPPRSFRGMADVPDACTVLPPREVYGLEPKVRIVFQVFEGKPKRLRDVVIRGNRFTRDKVIRRRVRVLPGDVIDMQEVKRALRNIEQTRFFQDPVTMRTPELRLEPVAGADDYLDIGIDVEDGATGELRWGIMIAPGTGTTAYISYNKRNFDLWNPPSSANPATAIEEILDNRAFHGGGQNLNLLLAPGSRQSQFRLTFVEPDLFVQHFDTFELRWSGQRLIRRLPDGYTSDTLGTEIGISRNFTDNFNAGVFLRHDSVEIDDLAPNASSLAFDAEGQTELRSGRLSTRYRDVDDPFRPTSGFELSLSAEMVGGFLGGEESLSKIEHNAHVYVPLAENEMGHRTVLHLEHRFGWAQAFGGSDDVFLTERFYMGGFNLRGLDYRRAGPSQFGRPIGGEALYTGSVEVFFPLVATRSEGEVRDRELLRGVVFTDFGLLGLSIDDPTFGELRASSGFGLRIELPVPGMELPIALDFGWPWQFEESDSRRYFYWTFGR